VSVGLPDITNNVVIDAVENVVTIIAGVGRLFGDDEPKHLPEAPPYPALLGCRRIRECRPPHRHPRRLVVGEALIPGQPAQVSGTTAALKPHS
jgi:hypothetical protein